MPVRYGGPRQRHRDTCHRVATNDGGDYCQYRPGEPVDACVSQGVLTARAPAALTLSLEVTARLEQERQALDRLWQPRLERAAYASERAARHDRVVEPEPRVVARQLAQAGDAKRTAQRHLQEEDERVVPAQPQPLSAAERSAMAQLAPNIPALWHAPTTTLAERKEMVRQIIRRVMVAGEGTSARLQITMEWVGGATTAGVITRPMSRIEHLRDDSQLGARLRALAPAGYSTVPITACLACEGFRSPKQAKPFSRPAVGELMRRFAVHQPSSRRHLPLRTHEWWLSALACAVGVSNSTRPRWRQGGGLHARWHAERKRWVAWADEAELQRLKQRGARPTGDKSHHMWLDAPPSQPTASSHLTHV
ncbi:MAG TPA: hypothetical protein VGC99_11635 [Candidatus Tectomicrobia bacterium]